MRRISLRLLPRRKRGKSVFEHGQNQPVFGAVGRAFAGQYPREPKDFHRAPGDVHTDGMTELLVKTLQPIHPQDDIEQIKTRIGERRGIERRRGNERAANASQRLVQAGIGQVLEPETDILGDDRRSRMAAAESPTSIAGTAVRSSSLRNRSSRSVSREGAATGQAQLETRESFKAQEQQGVADILGIGVRMPRHDRGMLFEEASDVPLCCAACPRWFRGTIVTENAGAVNTDARRDGPQTGPA
jgi:hypothetical protein